MGYADQARNPDALKVALSGLPSGRLTVADFGRVTADNETFAGWVLKMKQRFREPPAASTPPGPARPAPMKQAANAGPSKG
jgi:hypothetical protein